MKFGIRKPNIKKRVKARTTGRAKRAVKKSVNPMYGKKGMGYVKNPKKAVYNKVYNKTTVGIGTSSSSGNTQRSTSTSGTKSNGRGFWFYCFMFFFWPFWLLWMFLKGLVNAFKNK